MKGSFASTPLTTGWPSLIESVSPGPATIRLMKLVSDSWSTGCGQASSPLRLGTALRVSVDRSLGRVEDHDVPDLGVAEVVADPVDEHPLADVQRRLHRAGGDLVGLDDEGLDQERQANRQRDDHDQLDEAPRAPSWVSGSAGSIAGPCVLGLLTLGILCFVLGFPG